ncbi:MAG: radical SAM protein, partial [Armatimonadetes bacterium]|nr:radical SAM protein [Armatimonadota bacterium]
MATCEACGRSSGLISEAIGACLECLRSGHPEALAVAQARRRAARRRFGLPEEIPRDAYGATCDRCANACRLAPSAVGYCGVRAAAGSSVVAFPDAGAAAVEWYLDPLPTNCVAAWACAASGAGYPRYAHSPTGDRGYFNLAVFYNGCNFDCAFCQNWHHRYRRARPRTIEDLGEAGADPRVACICFFGGDPAPHSDHALGAARLALEKRRSGILRVCWETNGAMSPRILREMMEISRATGGTIKFDLKAWSEPLHIALCGVSNRRTLQNFQVLAEAAGQDEPP